MTGSDIGEHEISSGSSISRDQRRSGHCINNRSRSTRNALRIRQEKSAEFPEGVLFRRRFQGENAEELSCSSCHLSTQRTLAVSSLDLRISMLKVFPHENENCFLMKANAPLIRRLKTCHMYQSDRPGSSSVRSFQNVSECVGFEEFTFAFLQFASDFLKLRLSFAF